MKAPVIEIKRFAVHDGDGIRTTVFLKGCPLRCLWCHNPEGLRTPPELAYRADKCRSCLLCVAACPQNAHTATAEGHVFLRERCVGCGRCEAVCPSSALKHYGREMTPEELLPVLLEDRDFYENSGGGVTLSGGECLMHADFCAELLRLLKENGIHTAVDTCGFVPREALDRVMPYTDVFLYDVKALDASVHKRCTGQSNERILENLRYLDACGKELEIRIPFVPDCNAGEIAAIGAFLAPLPHVTKLRVLPYHSFAASKYASLGLASTLPKTLPTEEALAEARATLRGFGLTVVE